MTGRRLRDRGTLRDPPGPGCGLTLSRPAGYTMHMSVRHPGPWVHLSRRVRRAPFPRSAVAVLTTAAAATALACAGGDATAPPDAASPQYRFGVKFEPPAGRVVHGVGQWIEYNAKYVALLPASIQPASELSFIPIADTVRGWSSAKIAGSLAAMDAAGRIPLVNLSLWAHQPTAAELATMSDKLFGVDDDIANDTQWDARLRDFANVLQAYRKPVLLRIGGEFNGWWNGYHPYDFPKAYRKIVGMIRAAGADNVAFVWCYYPAGPDDFDAKNAVGEWKWYPGDDVVDWFSIDLFQVGDLTGATTARGSLTAYGRTLKFLDMAVARQRPVVIAESSPASFDLATSGAQAWSEWFVPYFGLIASRPEVVWFVYINYDWTKASRSASSGWKNNDLTANPSLAAQYAAELAKAKYLHSTDRALLKDFGKYK